MPPPTARERRRQALQRQTERVGRQVATWQQQSQRLSLARLLLFLLAFVATAAAFFTNGPRLALLTAVLAAIPFLVTVYLHRRLEAGLQRHRLWRELRLAHLARMDLAWEQLPAARFHHAPPNHPFALDLDLLGDYALHRLLDTAATRDGSQRLLEWLLDTAPEAGTIQLRQALVQELVPLARFRDRLALQARLAGRDQADHWAADKVRAWLAEPPPGPGARRLLLLLAGLGLINLLLLGLNLLGLIPAGWVFGLFFYFAIYFTAGRQSSQVFRRSLELRDAFEQLAAVFQFLERYRYGRNSRLRAHCQPFLSVDTRPSRYLRRVRQVSAASGLSQNPVLWLLLNLFVPWDLFFGYQLARVREQIAGQAPRWLSTWSELEALGALANLQYLNPDFSFPTFAAAEETPIFTGRELGHPLIPHHSRICNDFTLTRPGEVVIITGSNMAGKSSFLRTLGVNLCLAYAGGPVNATALHCGWFRLYSAIKVTDSVTDGISYFYAEVKRLKGLLVALEQAETRPVFFLIDEIFRGTNNRERLLGSRAYLQALLGRQGLGAISTHDLELVKLAEGAAGVHNYHFRDAIAGGRMVFDYTLRPGPCPTTNALKIMRLEGLPVPEEGAL